MMGNDKNKTLEIFVSIDQNSQQQILYLNST